MFFFLSGKQRVTRAAAYVGCTKFISVPPARFTRRRPTGPSIPSANGNLPTLGARLKSSVLRGSMVLKNLKSMAISRHLIGSRVFSVDFSEEIPFHRTWFQISYHFGMMISGQIWRIWEFSNDLRQISQKHQSNPLVWVGGHLPQVSGLDTGGTLPIMLQMASFVGTPGVYHNSWLKRIQWKPSTLVKLEPSRNRGRNHPTDNRERCYL